MVVAVAVVKIFSVVSELVVCWVVGNTFCDASTLMGEEKNMLLEVLKFVGSAGVMSSWFNVFNS